MNREGYKKFYSNGYQVFSGVIEKELARKYKTKLAEVYRQQLLEFGTENIEAIGEENIVRSPFLYDPSFQDVFYNSFAKRVVKDILGEHAILSLQNGIIVSGNKDHHQSFYHRDIIHQTFTSSRPLAINLYFCLDDYNQHNGGTTFIPESHKREGFLCDSEETPNVEGGSVILFDSMIFHKAGTNNTETTRCGINNMYTLPFLKQQINYPFCLKEKTSDPQLNRLLGFDSKEHLGVDEFRKFRLERLSQ